MLTSSAFPSPVVRSPTTKQAAAAAAGITALSAAAKAKALRRIVLAGLLGTGVGAGVAGIAGLRNRQRLPPRDPIEDEIHLPYPQLGSAPALPVTKTAAPVFSLPWLRGDTMSHWASVPWAIPGMVAAGGTGLGVGSHVVKEHFRKQHKGELNSQLEQAKKDYEAAMLGQYDQGKLHKLGEAADADTPYRNALRAGSTGALVGSVLGFHQYPRLLQAARDTRDTTWKEMVPRLGHHHLIQPLALKYVQALEKERALEHLGRLGLTTLHGATGAGLALGAYGLYRGGKSIYNRLLGKTATAREPVSLDQVCDLIEKRAGEDLVGLGTGGYLALAGLLAAGTGVGTKHYLDARSKDKLMADALKHRALLRQMQNPPDVYVSPVPSHLRTIGSRPQIEADSHADLPDPLGEGA